MATAVSTIGKVKLVTIVDANHPKMQKSSNYLQTSMISYVSFTKEYSKSIVYEI